MMYRGAQFLAHYYFTCFIQGLHDIVLLWQIVDTYNLTVTEVVYLSGQSRRRSTWRRAARAAAAW